MPFAGQYMLALLVVALMLFVLYAAIRALGRRRLLACADQRLVTVVETTPLTQNATVHVVKVAGCYYLVGAGNGHVQTLAAVPPEQVENWMDHQRTVLARQTRSLADIGRYLRKPPH
jgi:flagellar biogenesis protein FliO